MSGKDGYAQGHQFTDEFADQLRQAEEKRDEVVAETDRDTKAERKQKRQNRIMMEDLPVLEREVLEPEGCCLTTTLRKTRSVR